jgi:hypothetical protein
MASDLVRLTPPRVSRGRGMVERYHDGGRRRIHGVVGRITIPIPGTGLSLPIVTSAG